MGLLSLQNLFKPHIQPCVHMNYQNVIFYRQLGSSRSVATPAIKLTYPDELSLNPQTLHIYTYGHYWV